jgi:hypothetical protein
MKNKIIFCLFFISFSALAQQPTQNYWHKNTIIDLAFAAGKNQYSEAFALTHLHHYGKHNNFSIGYGLRFTNYNGFGLSYTTAPAKYTSTKQNLGTIFSDDIPENIDSLRVNKVATSMLNATIHLQYNYKKLFVNFNIDAFGFSFGKKNQGNYSLQAQSIDQSLSYNREQSIKPTTYNLLLTSDNDIGSLNSEFSIGYWFHKKYGIRLGYCFLFTEYTTAETLRLGNNRFRNKSQMALIAISYAPFN